MTENQQPLTQDQKIDLALANLREKGWHLWRNTIAFPNAAYVEMAEFFYSNCIELLNFGVENGNAIPDLSLLFDYYMNFPEQMQFIGLDVIHYLRFVVDVLFAQTVRDNYFPGYDIQKIHNQFIDFKNNNGPNLMICKSDFARGRVTALQNYWKEIDWKYYSIYQLNYDFVGITEFEAAFWWKLLQRIYHNNEYYQQTFIEIRQKFYDKSLDEKVFDNDEVKMGNYRFFLNSDIYVDMHQINWTVLQQLRNPNFKLYQDVEKIKQYLLRTIPGTNDELLTPDDFDIRVEDYYNDFVSGGIESVIIELDELIDCFERLGKENYQNIPTFFTIVCIRLALNGIKWLDFQKAKPDLLNFIKWCEENKIQDMDNIRNIEDVSKNLVKFAQDKTKSLSSWIIEQKTRDEYIRKLKAAKAKKELCTRYQSFIDEADTTHPVSIAACGLKIEQRYSEISKAQPLLDPVDIYNNILMEKDKELLAINKDKANELKEQAEYDESYWKDEIWRYSLPVYFASDDGAVDKDKNEIPLTLVGANQFANTIAKEYPMNPGDAKQFLNDMVDPNNFDQMEKYWTAFNAMIYTNLQFLMNAQEWNSEEFFNYWYPLAKSFQNKVREYQKSIDQQYQKADDSVRIKAKEEMTHQLLKNQYEQYKKDLDAFLAQK